MNTWRTALSMAAAPAAVSGLTSLSALAWRGRTDTASAVAPLNATSHMVWGDGALMVNRPTWRHTAVGLTLHAGSAAFWALLYQRYLGSTAPRSLLVEAGAAALMGVAVATVDLKLAPPRLRPGFERRLSASSLVWVFGSLAFGLAAGALMARR